MKRPPRCTGRPVSDGHFAGALFFTVSAAWLGASGCTPDLSGLMKGDGDMSVPDSPGDGPASMGDSHDMAVAQGGGVDMRKSGPGVDMNVWVPMDMAVPAVPCDTPQLLVLFGSGHFGGTLGRVLRYSIAPSGALTRCGDISLQGNLPSEAASVAYLSPTEIAVGDNSGIYFINTTDDQTMYPTYKATSLSGHTYPRDLIPVVFNGQTVLAINYSTDNDPDGAGDHMEVTDGSKQLFLWSYSDMPAHPLNDSKSITASPYDPGAVTYVDYVYEKAANEMPLPFNGMNQAATTRLDSVGTNAYPDSIYSPGPPKAGQTKEWAFVNGGNIGQPDTVYLAKDVSGIQLEGPMQCTKGFTGCASPAHFLHAVPDPTNTGKVIAICGDQGVGDNAFVVRFDGAGNCEEIFSSADIVVDEPLIIRLAIGL